MKILYTFLLPFNAIFVTIVFIYYNNSSFFDNTYQILNFRVGSYHILLKEIHSKFYKRFYIRFKLCHVCLTGYPNLFDKIPQRVLFYNFTSVLFQEGLARFTKCNERGQSLTDCRIAFWIIHLPPKTSQPQTEAIEHCYVVL